MRTSLPAILGVILLGTILAGCDSGGDGAATGSGGTAGAPAATGGAGGSAATDGGGAAGEPAPATGCAALTVERDSDVGGYLSEVYSWYDSECKLRTAAMAHNDQADPGGGNGGCMRRYTYDVDGATRTNTGSGANGQWNGFGYIVSHNNGGTPWGFDSNATQGTHQVVLAGAHHAIHQYDWNIAFLGKTVHIVVQWFFATGRDHPVFAVTYDLTAYAAGEINCDARSPYGDLLWDGDVNGAVDGVGWGDHYKFTSLDSPITMQSGWDYSQPNTVPYSLEWSVTNDAEMGLVQTQTYAQHDAGGSWLTGSWGQANTAGPMPEDWNWPYQLNQYELPFTTTSHRVAWGMMYGAVGLASFDTYGYGSTASGYPYQSYSTYVVLDRHSEAPVAEQVAIVEAVQQTTLSATAGTVLTAGPAGVGRTDTVDYAPVGYDRIFGTWEVTAANNQTDVSFTVAGSRLPNPTLVLRGYTATTVPTEVLVDGAALTADVDYFASLDDAGDSVWITLNRDLAGQVEVEVQ
jgi:hypothetical protein